MWLRCWTGMALLLLVGGGAYSLAHAAVILALPADGSNPLAAEELMVTREGIRLHVQARRLGEVLQGIQAQSGIRIEVRSELMRKPITARIEAPDWRLTLEKLLVGFNWMEISDDQRKIRQVIVGGEGRDVALPPITGPHVRRFEVSPIEESAAGRQEGPSDIQSPAEARRLGRSGLPAEGSGARGIPPGATGEQPFFSGPPGGALGPEQGPLDAGPAGDGPPYGLGASGDSPPPDSVTVPYETGHEENGPAGEGPPM